MNKLTYLILSSVLIFAAIACDNTAKTSSNAPNSTAATDNTMDKGTAQNNQKDASSGVRKAQQNADIRAREQRHDAMDDDNERADGDLESEVRSKLEANLPASKVAVDAKNGVVTVSGTVVDQQQLQKIEPLAKQIKGVQTIVVKATVATAAKP